jgi:hypothetical protein
MNLAEIEDYLNKGEELGFVKDTGDSEYLGWILISKRSIPPGFILTDDKDEPYLRLKKEMEHRAEKPYHLQILELKKSVHESDEYENNEDYKLRENYFFAALEDVKKKISELGYSISNIKHRREIDAP